MSAEWQPVTPVPPPHPPSSPPAAGEERRGERFGGGGREGDEVRSTNSGGGGEKDAAPLPSESALDALLDGGDNQSPRRSAPAVSCGSAE